MPDDYSKELPEQDIYQIIEQIAYQQATFKEMYSSEWQKYIKSHPSSTSYHPLLCDYDWVYEHVEEIFCSFQHQYFSKQGPKEYSIFFKALTDKYSLEDDYNALLRGDIDIYKLRKKWKRFATKLIDFLEPIFDSQFTSSLDRANLSAYFLRYSGLYEGLIQDEGISGSQYLYSKEATKSLIREQRPGLKISITRILDNSFIRQISRTTDVFEFYEDLEYIEEWVSTEPFLECHKIFCDEQVANIKDGILPCLMREYGRADTSINPRRSFFQSDYLYNIERRIFDEKRTPIEKSEFFEEVSKYVLISLFISRYFEADPHNLLVDIETLYHFALSHELKLKGGFVYEFLMDYEAKTVFEIKEFYESVRGLPLKEMLYDDWTTQKEALIESINASLLNPSKLKMVTDDTGYSFYDITDIDSPILVSNTVVRGNTKNGIGTLHNRIMKGEKEYICLSLQDGKHQTFFDDQNTVNHRTIRFVYGPLDPKKVGIIHHEDAYSTSIDEAEWEYGFKRMLYTLDEFMNMTISYNEITYKIDGEAFFPIGILCEDEITEDDYDLGKEFGILIFFRTTKDIIPDEPNVVEGKKYVYQKKEKNVFLN